MRRLTRSLAWGLMASALWLSALTAEASKHKPESARELPIEREDIRANFKAAACDEASDGLPFKAWDVKVYDAQIEGRRVESRSGLPVDYELVRAKARALARSKRSGGYAAGFCDNGVAWIAAFPAAEPLVPLDKNHIKLPVPTLKAACESWRVDFAAAQGGEPQRLTPSGDTLNLAALGDGLLSVTCQPHKPRWQGPVLWYLYPVGAGPAQEPPEKEALTKAPDQALPEWINRVRVASGLKPVVFKRELNDEANVLTIDSSLTHNRLLLRRAENSLGSRKIKLLGENRVKGHDAHAMAWLLWSSPRHRQLILNRDATAAGLSRREIRGEQIIAIVFAADAPLTTVKAPAKAKKKL